MHFTDFFCPDPFLECQHFVKLTIYFIRARSSLTELFLRVVLFLYITLLVGEKEEKCGWEMREGWEKSISPH